MDTHQKNECSINLITDNKVILVQCPGYESQLFIPVLSDKGITMKNLVFTYKAPLPIANEIQIKKSKPILIENNDNNNGIQRANIDNNMHRRRLHKKNSSKRNIAKDNTAPSIKFDKTYSQSAHGAKGQRPKFVWSRESQLNRRAVSYQTSDQHNDGVPSPFDVIRKLYYLDSKFN